MSKELVGIGEAATRFGITLRAIRFYEDRGLLKTKRAVDRNARVLDRAAMTRLSEVLELKKHGLTILEIGEAIKRARGKEPRLTRDQARAQLAYLISQRVMLDQQIATIEATFPDN